MNKEIEEIGRTMCRHFGTNVCGSCDAHNTCMIHLFAADIHRAGYRKRRVGEWVKVMNHRECSNCGYNAPYKKIKAGYHLQDLTKYCPNCGAKMEGDENDA